MRRTTALVLFVGLAISGFTPWLQALTGVQPHACCLRRICERAGHGTQFSAPQARNGNCCPPLTTPQSAILAKPDVSVPNWASRGSYSREASAPPFVFDG